MQGGLITLPPGWRWLKLGASATRLRPDAAETHWRAHNIIYYGRRDYAGALAELEIVRRALPK